MEEVVKSKVDELSNLISKNEMAKLKEMNEIWIFGYASLVWFPNFDFTNEINGHIKGFCRRFYQASQSHRGTVDCPGRCATLLRSNGNENTYGVAYRLCGKTQIELAMEKLNMRETTLGGYELDASVFYPHDQLSDLECIPVLFYVGTAQSDFYTGEESLEKLASIIATANGPAGSNKEYLFKLCQWQRNTFPLIEDQHLYGLERLTKLEIKKRPEVQQEDDQT